MLAALTDPDTLAVFIPIFMLLIPIIIVLTKHQQKMAMIMRGEYDNQAKADIEALSAQMQQVQAMLFHQSALLEDVRRLHSAPLETNLGDAPMQLRVGKE